MKNRIIISSILTIALCLSMIAGSTFALFTSESKVDVTVSAGTVDVDVEASALTRGSTLGTALGTAELKDNVITLTNLVPGDYVTFTLTITNKSNVTVNYRALVKTVEDKGLLDGLVITYNNAFASDWKKLEPTTANVAEVVVTISLPEDASNDYQNTSCKLAYVVEAVQGNVDVVVGDPAVSITPENWSTTTIVSDTTYKLTGDFGGVNVVAFTMANGVKNVVFDGSNATNIDNLVIVHGGRIIDNPDDHLGTREGKVTVKSFKVLSQINVFACKTEVEICNNVAEALYVHAGNCAINIHHNTFDANFESHSVYSSASSTLKENGYAVSLDIYDYELWFDNNTVTDASSHAVGINGWQGTFNVGEENTIHSFSGNDITVNSTSKTKRAALKIWDDETYADTTESHSEVNSVAQALIDSILANGKFTIVDGYDHAIFCLYDTLVNE